MTEDYKIKYIPLNNKNLKNQFSFADIVYLELTRECNLRCKHCLNNSGKLMQNQLNLDELKKLVQDLIVASVQEIRFTGGEPLMCDGIYELIKLANDNGVCTSIGTNGTDEGVHSRIELPFIIRGCKAGQRAIAIMPDGDIQLCGFLSAQKFSAIENVRNIQNWRKFWNELQKIDKLKYLRDNLE